MLSTFSQYFMTLSATENLAEKMVHLFGDTIPSWLTVLIISLFPILENRGRKTAQYEYASGIHHLVSRESCADTVYPFVHQKDIRVAEKDKGL